MSQEVQDLLKKADLAIANLTTDGGYLNPEQSDRFLRTIEEQPTLINLVRSVRMNSPQMEINKVGFGSRILRAAVENTALSQGDRSKPDFSQVPLSTKEVIAEVRIPYGVLEDNIERGNFEQTLLTLIGERAALDLEELLIQGDVALVGTDAYLGLHNGVLKQVTSNIVDADGPPQLLIRSAVFSAALKALAPKYRRNKNSLKFFVTPDIDQDYREVVSARQTALGDAVVQGVNGNMRVHGVEIVPVSLMPDETVLLANPQNVIFGIQRQVRVESERLISERQLKVVLTARVAIALEDEEATAKITNLNNDEEEP